jgi:Predicted membrane protein
MNKIVFLKELELNLSKMKASDIEKHITFYDEMISDYMENGMLEEAAVAKIGDPKTIAEELIEGYDSIKIDMPVTRSKFLNMTLLILGFPLWGSLLLSGILLLASIYIILWCIPFVTGLGSIGFFTTSVIGIIGAPFIMLKSLPVGFVQLGAGIASIGISFLFGFATLIMCKKFSDLTKMFNYKLKTFLKRRVSIR